MENILILGGTGAMGKFLVKRLSASYHVMYALQAEKYISPQTTLHIIKGTPITITF